MTPSSSLRAPALIGMFVLLLAVQSQLSISQEIIPKRTSFVNKRRTPADYKFRMSMFHGLVTEDSYEEDDEAEEPDFPTVKKRKYSDVRSKTKLEKSSTSKYYDKEYRPPTLPPYFETGPLPTLAAEPTSHPPIPDADETASNETATEGPGGNASALVSPRPTPTPISPVMPIPEDATDDEYETYHSSKSVMDSGSKGSKGMKANKEKSGGKGSGMKAMMQMKSKMSYTEDETSHPTFAPTIALDSLEPSGVEDATIAPSSSVSRNETAPTTETVTPPSNVTTAPNVTAAPNVTTPVLPNATTVPPGLNSTTAPTNTSASAVVAREGK